MSFKVAYISMQMMSQMKYFRPWSMQWWDEERTVGPAKCNAVALSESKWKRRIFWTFRWEWSRWRRSGSRVPVEESQTVAMQAMVTALRKAPTTIVEKGMLIPPWRSLPCTSKYCLDARQSGRARQPGSIVERVVGVWNRTSKAQRSSYGTYQGHDSCAHGASDWEGVKISSVCWISLWENGILAAIEKNKCTATRCF